MKNGFLLNKSSKRGYNLSGFFISLVILLSLFGPWITLSYDSYAVLNPITRLGEKHYHSRIELTPLFGSVLKDNQLEARIWFITPSITFSAVSIIIIAFFNIMNYDKRWVYFLIFLSYILALYTFFLSLGRGISLGNFTKVGWGLKLAFGSLFLLFMQAFLKMTSGVVSRSLE
jgi:hypothetical protein